MVTNKAGVSVDLARKGSCDAKLDFPCVDNVYDYGALYDTETLRSLIVEHYGH